MDMLKILEEKITLLVNHVKKLQSDKDILMQNYESLVGEHNTLKIENDKIVEENMRLQEKAKEAHVSTTRGNKQLEALNKERELTKVAVDDLIKSIDGLVKNEALQ